MRQLIKIDQTKLLVLSMLKKNYAFFLSANETLRHIFVPVLRIGRVASFIEDWIESEAEESTSFYLLHILTSDSVRKKNGGRADQSVWDLQEDWEEWRTGNPVCLHQCRQDQSQARADLLFSKQNSSLPSPPALGDQRRSHRGPAKKAKANARAALHQAALASATAPVVGNDEESSSSAAPPPSDPPPPPPLPPPTTLRLLTTKGWTPRIWANFNQLDGMDDEECEFCDNHEVAENCYLVCLGSKEESCTKTILRRL